MTWVKLDDGFFRNTKALAAGKDGRAMYVAGLCYCAAGLTDGKIITESVRVIAADADVHPKTADKLVAVELWDRVAEGYVVPDYLEFNPSRQQVIADREAARSRQKSHRDSRRDNTQTGAGSSRPPSSSRPPGSRFTSSSSSFIEPGDDEEVVAAVLELFADRKLAAANGTVKDVGPWKRKVLENAWAEQAPTAREWLANYDVSATQVADALVAGGVPASWNNCRKPA